MEFGETIPLFLLSLCYFGLTPVIGFSGLALIRFSLKDRYLARNIFITIISVAVLPILYMGFGIIQEVLFIPRCCAQNFGFVAPALSEILSFSIPYTIWFVYLSFTVGFIIAFTLVVPITLLIRHRRKKKLSYLASL
jgi:hypothetical protein